MYHPTVEAVALTLVDVPFTLATVILLSISSLVFKYPLLNFCVFILLEFFLTLSQTFCPDFSTYFLFILVVALSMKALFRGLAAIFKKAAPAQAVAGVLLLALSLYTGYQIPKPSMIGALRWISYINVSLEIHYKPRVSRFYE